MQAEGGLPGTAHVGLAFVAVAGGSVEVLVDDAGGGLEAADREWRLFHAFEGGSKGFEVRNFARHEELERVDRAWVVGVVDEALVDDFGARFGSDVAAEIDVEFAGDLEVVGCPGITGGVVEIDATTAGDGDEWVGIGGFAVGLEVLKVHANEGADDFEMAKLFGADVEEEVAASEIIDAVPALDGVLHGGGEFSVGAAELLKQELAELDVGSADVDGVHKFFNVVIHEQTSIGFSSCAEVDVRREAGQKDVLSLVGCEVLLRGCEGAVGFLALQR